MKRARGRAVPPTLALGFAARFLGAWAMALVALALLPRIEAWAIEATTSNLVQVLRLLGLEVRLPGPAIVSVGTTSITIVRDCTALMSASLLGAAMVAYPASWGWRLAGLGAGMLALWIYNLLRILLLMAVLAWAPGLFEPLHVYLWQTLTLIAVVAVFLGWLRWTPRGSAA